MQPLDFDLARKTVKFYACSACWGELEMIPDELRAELYQVKCKKCGDETKGYVTQHYVNRRRAESEFEKVNTEHLLKKMEVIDNPLKGKTTTELLSELGF